MDYVWFEKKLKKCCSWFRTYTKQFLIQNPELPNSVLVFVSISTSLYICTGIYI